LVRGVTRSRRSDYQFAATLERVSGIYAISIPARVSQDIGKRGNVPVIAVINDLVEVRASIKPAGGGRHLLQLNASARKQANAQTGARLKIALTIDEHPLADAIPDDLHRALRDEDALLAFQALPVGKQNHILHWIESSAREATREKRIALAVEVAAAKREKMTRA
jgi:Bacteriocin-protection, YdeI or OmpD-Associated/Domain of unknown function (DUF1905)